MAIKRIWHGWTTPANADVYEKLLRDEVIPGIEAKNIAGLQSFDLLRQERENEVEFITIMTFEDMQSVIDFQGEDYTRSYVPDAAKRVLARWDGRAEHFEVRDARVYR